MELSIRVGKDRFMSKGKIVKISLFGPSGSGKSTVAKLIMKIIHEEYSEYQAILANVAEPLHLIQDFAYRQFGLLNTGQDGKLLQFLAQHFEQWLGKRCVDRIQQLIDLRPANQNLIFINSDCRNNAYGFLKNAGFVFIKIHAPLDIIRKRRLDRKDIGKFDSKNSIEQTNQIRKNYSIDNLKSLGDLDKNVNRFLQKVL